MVKCPECGENLTSSDKMCPKCGYKISGSEKKSSSTGNNKSTNKILAIIAIVVVIAIIGVLASGALSSDDSTSDVQVESNTVEPIQEDNSSSSSDDSDSESSTSSGEYWASAKTDKFHLPSCEWAEKISDANKIIYQSREDAIADGKEPCGVCNP